jgi:hypothetical protein
VTSRRSERIDGIVALIMALERATAAISDPGRLLMWCREDSVVL